MVYVFPLPVWPYVKMHTLYPSSADCTRCAISSNTSACPAPPANTRSKLKSNVLAFPGGATRSARPARSPVSAQ